MRLPGRTLQTFGASVPLSEEEWGLVARPEGEWLARGGELLVPAAALSLVGRHNALNALAALALASSVVKIGPPVREALAQFRGLPHRMERDRRSGRRALRQRFEGDDGCGNQCGARRHRPPVVLIAGGDAKGQSFVPLEAGRRPCVQGRSADRPRCVARRARTRRHEGRRRIGRDARRSRRRARSSSPFPATPFCSRPHARASTSSQATASEASASPRSSATASKECRACASA